MLFTDKWLYNITQNKGTVPFRSHLIKWDQIKKLKSKLNPYPSIKKLKRNQE